MILGSRRRQVEVDDEDDDDEDDDVEDDDVEQQPEAHDEDWSPSLGIGNSPLVKIWSKNKSRSFVSVAGRLDPFMTSESQNYKMMFSFNVSLIFFLHTDPKARVHAQELSFEPKKRRTFLSTEVVRCACKSADACKFNRCGCRRVGRICSPTCGCLTANCNNRDAAEVGAALLAPPKSANDSKGDKKWHDFRYLSSSVGGRSKNL